ncbi:MAG: ribonuclease Z [Flavobacteriaceae bacterium]|nr:ribonuclease Z [Flavobacteriaceae bacterium]
MLRKVTLPIVKPKSTDLKKKSDLYEQFNKNYPNFKKDNIILDFSEIPGIDIEQILLFSSLIKKHKKEGRSFVVVYKLQENEELMETIFITPTLREAEDVVELEEIERDLGI